MIAPASGGRAAPACTCFQKSDAQCLKMHRFLSRCPDVLLEEGVSEVPIPLIFEPNQN